LFYIANVGIIIDGACETLNITVNFPIDHGEVNAIEFSSFLHDEQEGVA